MIDIKQLYLGALEQMFADDKLDCVLQDTDIEGGGNCGILWLVRKGTTNPEMSVAFKFQAVDFTVAVITRNERSALFARTYSEGIDSLLKELQHFIRTGRIAAPKAA